MTQNNDALSIWKSENNKQVDCKFVMSADVYVKFKEKFKEIIENNLEKYKAENEKADEEIVKDAILRLKQISIQIKSAEDSLKNIYQNFEDIIKGPIKREQYKNIQQLLVSIKNNADQIKKNSITIENIVDVVLDKLSLLNGKRTNSNKVYQFDLSSFDIYGTAYETELFGFGKVNKIEGAQLVGVDTLNKIFSIIYEDKLIKTNKLCKSEK